MAEDAVLSMENVSFEREKTILQNINWTLKKGENWVLMGLNGAGKTTLLSLLYGDYWATTGKINVLGETFGKTNVLELKKRIGLISTAIQSQFPEHHLAQYIVLSGKFGTIGIHNDFEQSDLNEAINLLEKLGGSELINKQYRVLSQGQRQLVLIARALLGNPELLILDEPCNGLDLFARESLLVQINKLAQLPNHPTLLFVSHYTEEILPIFQNVMLLKNGKIFAQGTRSEILTESLLSKFYPKPIKIIPISNQRIAVYPANL
ncbi:ABC transporter ATP-binding protein [Leuconostoc suionicum]|uniref:ABC transporter ATP-binding protein n=1 Tax=Leuconostoc suionicum TaxID=1511761 RepID=UPI0032E0532E